MKNSRRRRSKIENISGRSSTHLERPVAEAKTPETKIWPAINRVAIGERIVNHVGDEAEEIVTEMIAHAKGGNFQAMKYLFEMAGLFPASAAADSAPKDTLETRLRDRMEEFVRESKQKLERGESDKAVSVP